MTHATHRYVYHFSLKDAGGYPSLAEEDKNILDIVIDKLGKMSKTEIVRLIRKISVIPCPVNWTGDF